MYLSAAFCLSHPDIGPKAAKNLMSFPFMYLYGLIPHVALVKTFPYHEISMVSLKLLSTVLKCTTHFEIPYNVYLCCLMRTFPESKHCEPLEVVYLLCVVTRTMHQHINTENLHSPNSRDPRMQRVAFWPVYLRSLWQYNPWTHPVPPEELLAVPLPHLTSTRKCSCNLLDVFALDQYLSTFFLRHPCWQKSMT